MTIRITLGRNVNLDIDDETEQRLLDNIKEELIARNDASYTQSIMNETIERILENLDMQDLAERTAQQMSISDIVHYLSSNINSQITSAVLNDDRFIQLVTRYMNNIASNLADDTTERVTARIQATTTTQGDM